MCFIALNKPLNTALIMSVRHGNTRRHFGNEKFAIPGKPLSVIIESDYFIS